MAEETVDTTNLNEDGDDTEMSAEEAEYQNAVLSGLFPSEERLDEWKKQYPTANFRGLNFPGMYVVYKSMSVKEYRDMQKTREEEETKLGRPLSATEAETQLLDMCVFWPLDFSERLKNDTLPAAVPTITSQYIMVASGFVDVSPEIL